MQKPDRTATRINKENKRSPTKQERIRIKHEKTSAINHANLRNLRQVNTTNGVEHQEIGKLWFATVNTRSIKIKEDMILEALNEYHIDLLVTTETWLRDTEFTSNGYLDQN